MLINIDDVVSPFNSTNQVCEIGLSLVSSETVLSWSYGEVKNAMLYNSDTKKPVLNGLFCPKIFGLTNNYECLCSIPSLDELMFCKKCGLDLGLNRNITRGRFGHISLALPVVHSWFYQSVPNILAILLENKAEIIHKIVNCDLHIITDTVSKDLKIGQIIDSELYKDLWKESKWHKISSGGNAILSLLSKVNLDTVKSNLENKNASSEESLDNKIKLVNGFIENKIKPIWTVIKILPVLPAELRPFLVLDDEKYASSDLNELYKRIVIANQNVFMMLESDNKEDVVFEKFINGLRILQNSVDCLITSSSDNNNSNYNNMALKSLTELLKGKRGRFRQNLLGRRVDYSGRSVIAPGPDLLIQECAIPRRMARELFKPFIYAKMMLNYGIKGVKLVKFIIASKPKLVDIFLEEIVKFYPVLLNRAPTLHKLSMQGFKVKLTNEKVIRLHPLVCMGFNADFDGDQMAVHIPLSKEARTETILLMMSINNVLHPAHGGSSILPTQDMIMGLYYMSLVFSEKKKEKNNICFTNYNDIRSAILTNKVNIHTRVKFRIISNNNDQITIVSTPGRLLINEIIPKKCGFIYDIFLPEFTKSIIIELVEEVNKFYGQYLMAKFCSDLMKLGFKYASFSGVSLAKKDLKTSSYKKYLLNKLRNFLKNNKEKNLFLRVWSKVISDIYDNIDYEISSYDGKYLSSINIMFNSGARGTLAQIRQMVGARGYITGFNGKVCKIPILTSYKEGLSLIQFFCSIYGSRRGLIDTALKTASSGYLSRKLVEASRECVIKEIDCGTKLGLSVDLKLNHSFIKHRLMGRYLLESLIIKNKIYINKNTLIDDKNINYILKYKNKIYIRSPVMCQAKSGICSLCYGINLCSRKSPKLGDSVGVLAAQSIGEPGTQLTLRTFHGLGNVEEKEKKHHDPQIQNKLLSTVPGLLKIKNLSCVCSISGEIVVVNTNCVILIYQNNNIIRKYLISRGTCLLVFDGEYVTLGKVLCYQHLINTCVTLIKGLLIFENIISNINLKETFEVDTGLTNYNLYPNNKKYPLICLILNNIKLVYKIENNHTQTNLLIGPKTKINVFDKILEILSSKKIIFPYDGQAEGLEKLSKLFDIKSEGNNALISNTNGVLRSGEINNDISIYVIDPYSTYKKPTVYEICGNLPTLFEDNKNIIYDEMLIPGEIDILNYIHQHGLNKFINFFVDKVQEIYENQGVNVNSKHIEVVLKQMTNNIISVESNLTKDTEYDEYELKTLHTNTYINSINDKPIMFSRRIIGVSDICNSQSSLLSTISFQGAIKALIRSVITGGISKLDGIKDHIILGKLPPIGAGYLKSDTSMPTLSIQYLLDRN